MDIINVAILLVDIGILATLWVEFFYDKRVYESRFHHKAHKKGVPTTIELGGKRYEIKQIDETKPPQIL